MFTTVIKDGAYTTAQCCSEVEVTVCNPGVELKIASQTFASEDLREFAGWLLEMADVMDAG